MSAKEIVEEFPDNQMVQQVMDGKKSMPSDPARRAIYQVQIARLRRSLGQEARKKPQTAAAPVPAEPAASEGAKTAEELAADASRRCNSREHDTR